MFGNNNWSLQKPFIRFKEITYKYKFNLNDKENESIL